MYDREKGGLYNRNERGIVETDDLSEFYKNQKTELVKREFKLTTKAFEYYRYFYNFGQFKTVYVDYREKNGKEIKKDEKFERVREKERNEYFKEELKSFNQQLRENDLREKEYYTREWNKELLRFKGFSEEEINKELNIKKPVNIWENKSCCLNDLEKELDKLDYCIAYEYLRIHTSAKIHDIFYYEHYEKGKNLEEIVMLAVKEGKKSDYIMKKVKEREGLRMPNLEKEVLCL